MSYAIVHLVDAERPPPRVASSGSDLGYVCVCVRAHVQARVLHKSAYVCPWAQVCGCVRDRPIRAEVAAGVGMYAVCMRGELEYRQL